MTEMEQLEYLDSITDVASAMETVGCRRFLLDFREAYPQLFQEVLIQIHRLEQKPVARLLDKDAPSV